MDNVALDLEEKERDNVIPFSKERHRTQTGGKMPPSGINWLLEIPRETKFLAKGQGYLLDIFIVYEADRDYYKLYHENILDYVYVDPHEFSIRFALVKILGYTKL